MEMTLKLTRLPKGSGGVRYEPTDEKERETLNSIYLGQDALRALAGGSDFPQTLKLTITTKGKK